jgi:hypothetical protein
LAEIKFFVQKEKLFPLLPHFPQLATAVGPLGNEWRISSYFELVFSKIPCTVFTAGLAVACRRNTKRLTARDLQTG